MVYFVYVWNGKKKKNEHKVIIQQHRHKPVKLCAIQRAMIKKLIYILYYAQQLPRDEVDFKSRE